MRRPRSLPGSKSQSDFGFKNAGPLWDRRLLLENPGGREGASIKIAILGSGLMGGKLGTILARAGYKVVFSYSHSEAKLKNLARVLEAMQAPAPHAKPRRMRKRYFLPCIGPA